MNDFPWTCSTCGRLNMIDLERLETRVVSKLVSAEGFFCGCGFFNAVIYWTDSLRAALKRLSAMDVNRRDFGFHLGKGIRKAQGIREKVEG